MVCVEQFSQIFGRFVQGLEQVTRTRRMIADG